MELLFASLAALATGPALYRLLHSRPAALAALDGFAFVAIAGLVVLHALPDAFASAGGWALLAAAVGLFGPELTERRLHSAARGAHDTALLLALLGLALHTALDGAALGQHRRELGLAVVLHRVPVSMALWLLLRPRWGSRVALLLLAAVGTITVGGYLAAGSLPAERTWLGVIIGLVSGSLLHVVVHSPISSGVGQRERRAAGAGACGAIGLLYGMTALPGADAGGEGFAAVGRSFTAMALQSAPALLTGYIGAGLLDAFLPLATVRWLRRSSSLGQALRGVGFGLPLPVCSCGVIPLYRSLVLRGAPTAAAIAFLVATPEIGIDAVMLSLPLLGLQLALVRVGCAALVAIATGWLLGRIVGPGNETGQIDQASTPPAPLGARFARALRTGFGEVVDTTGPWIVLGLVVAAIGTQLLGPGARRANPAGLEVTTYALIGIPTYICATGATPLVAMLISRGASPGAALALLLTGPATNATTFGVLGQLHGRRPAALFAAVVGMLAIALGHAVNAFLPRLAVTVPEPGAPLHATSPVMSALSRGSLAILSLLLVGSLFRQGPRSFLAQVLAGAVRDDDQGGHDHAHHGHSHHDHAHHDHAHH